MMYAFILSLITISSLTAAERTAPFRLPIKLTLEQLRESDVKAQRWLVDSIKFKSELIQQELAAFFPTPLVKMIESYRKMYSDKIQTVGIIKCAYENVLKVVRLSEAIQFNFDILLRYSLKEGSGGSDLELYNKDVFIAYMNFLNHHHSSKEWRAKLRYKAAFDQFFNTVQIDLLPKAIVFPIMDHFPLVVYSQYSTNPLSLKKRVEFFDVIADSCSAILQEHRLLPQGIQPRHLKIFCTICNGVIPYPWLQCFELLIKHQELPKESGFCDGRNDCCRTFRALRLIQPAS